jgi:putative membrane protein/putative copper resistance protein D
MGIDPAPHRSPYVIRILELFAAMPFHAFFGISLMMSSSLITSTFANPPAAWNVNPASDQSTAGAIAWGFGELPTLIVLLVLFGQWMKSDEREARRKDRKADRDGDSELNDYNAYLAGLAAHGGGGGSRIAGSMAELAEVGDAVDAAEVERVDIDHVGIGRVDMDGVDIDHAADVSPTA